MAAIEQAVPALMAGDNLTREEFLRIWDMNPGIKRAELLGGVVFMPSPLSVRHGDMEGDVGGWLTYYKAFTPGVASGHNTTSFILQDTPQPDVNLRILPEFGGASWLEGKFLAGAPELLTEVCWSGKGYDLHQKKDLYLEAGIREYVAVLLYEQEIRWHILEEGMFQLMGPGPDGIWRSKVFPGLWLDGKAFLDGDMRKVLGKLQEGLASAEHEAFVVRLAENKGKRG